MIENLSNKKKNIANINFIIFHTLNSKEGKLF